MSLNQGKNENWNYVEMLSFQNEFEIFLLTFIVLK